MTAATATSGPGPHHGPGPDATASDINGTITWADFKQWERQLTSTGGCVSPIRIRGRIDAIDLATGEIAPIYTTTAEAGGVLHIPCGNRREAACPACSAIYKRDAQQLVRAGLAGGKGIPESIAAHPCVFATFTAPSFGPVHARRMRGNTVLPCRPRRDANARRCPHGRDISCPTRHVEANPRLGQPLCPDCYDYESAVLFNAYAGQLWRRFTTYLPRHLARLAGVTQKTLRAQVRVRFVKVSEYQARGAVHFHAVIRLDDPGQDYWPPRLSYVPSLLCDAIRQVAASVRLVVGHRDQTVILGFGAQTDARPVGRDTIVATGKPLDANAVANYIAKYATKTLTAPGLPSTRIKHAAEIGQLRCSRHYQAMIGAAWQLGIRKWAHALGYGGHFLTKSRRYSVTFGQLRRARAEYRRQLRQPYGEKDPWGRDLDETIVLIIKTWRYAGTGYFRSPGAEQAAAAEARAREHHDQADTPPDHSANRPEEKR